MNNILVSVVVATYNSSPFIVEALNSVFDQTWELLELIITDDCSTDDTVELCAAWLSTNRNRFSNSVLISSVINTGIPGNVNRGLNAAKGHWIKLLAGDDTLKPNCVQDNLTWMSSHPEAGVLFSKVDVYKENFAPEYWINTIPQSPFDRKGIFADGRSATSQYKMLLICDRIHFSPSVFLLREAVSSVGGFDEKFKLLEDYPMWLKLTKAGYRLNFMNITTVNYRMHSKAINNIGRDYLLNPNYFRSENFRREYTYPYLPIDVRLDQRFQYFVSSLFKNERCNRNKKTTKLMWRFLSVGLNPFKYVIWIRKVLFKTTKDNEFYC